MWNSWIKSLGIYDFANIFYRFIINSTSSLYGIDGDAPFLVTVIADAQAQRFRLSSMDNPSKSPAIK